ncbi:MAG: hypothetical protein K2N14_05265 [Clostridia bacterium]|nr:hypothetical protein [Clostridia bacterium]
MEIGIRKSISLRIWILSFCWFALSLLCLIFWAVYRGNYSGEWWLNNGVEVVATGVDWGEGYKWNTDSDGHSWREHYYYCQYEYESEDGKLYSVKLRYEYRENAEAGVGSEIKILIDPNGSEARVADYERLTPHYTRDLIIAIIFSVPIPIVYYLLLYRGIYRAILNHKICKLVGEEVKDFIKSQSINKEATVIGEVVQTRSWLVSYVKVRYSDTFGETHERWAREWFTRKEAEFLKEKKFITIVTYKNTYGILEKSDIEIKQKKSKNYE